MARKDRKSTGGGRLTLNRNSSSGRPDPGRPVKSGSAGRIRVRQAEKTRAEERKEKKAWKAAEKKDRERRKRGNRGRIMMKSSDTASEVEKLQTQKQMNRKFKRRNLPMVGMAAALIIIFFFSAAMFVTVSGEHANLAYTMELMRTQMSRFFNFITGARTEGGIQFIVYRYIMIVMAGACLAASGAVYQGTFRNVLASPSTLGVMSGGSLGNIIYALFFLQLTAGAGVQLSDLSANQSLLGRNLQSLMVLAGCFVAVAIVISITLMLGRGKIRSDNLIITGIIFSSIISSFSSLVQFYLIETNPSDPRVDVIRNLSMGGFVNSFKLDQVLIMLTFLAPCVIILMCLSGRMDILALGDEQARTMGVNAGLYKKIIIGVNTIMTAVVIAFCGQIGFIGFVVPLAARRIVGPRFGRLLPASMLLGSTLLLVVYDVAVAVNMTGYLNVLTSGFGSAVMVIALVKGGGVTRADRAD